MGLSLQKLLPAAARQGVAFAEGKSRRTLRERFSHGSVQWSPDLQRVLELPRRTKPANLSVISAAMTATLKRPEGTQSLRDLQAWSLFEGPQAGGLVGALHTGAGKSLIGMLMPMVWSPVKQADGSWRPVRALLLVPPDLRAQFASDWEVYGKHWQLPNLAGGKTFVAGLPTLHVVSYSELQLQKNSNLLMEIRPELIMCDEASALRNFDTGRVRRVRRYFGDFPDTAFCAWDATLTSTTVEDYWHFLCWALTGGSPLPVEQNEVRRWARALDPQDYEDGYFMPGELMRFCAEGEPVRMGYQRRLVQTLGVVASEDNMLGIPLMFRERKPPPMPEDLVLKLKALRKKPSSARDDGWQRPDGEVLRDMTEVVACARQMAEGFFLRWRYPHGEPEELIEEWFLKRQNWNRDVRAVLSNPRVHMDTPGLCENAAERWYAGGCPGCKRAPREPHEETCHEQETHPLWESYCYPAWAEIKNRVYHVTEAVWVSDWLLHDAAAWARERPGIVWVDRPEFGHRLAKMTGLVYYGGGDGASEEIAEKFSEANGVSATSIICSVKANKKGKNLQHSFSRSLIVGFPASNDDIEQAIGRVYREGQRADRVEVDYYLHTIEFENAFEKAKERAHFVNETMGTAQKLVYGQFERAA